MITLAYSGLRYMDPTLKLDNQMVDPEGIVFITTSETLLIYGVTPPLGPSIPTSLLPRDS